MGGRRAPPGEPGCRHHRQLRLRAQPRSDDGRRVEARAGGVEGGGGGRFVPAGKTVYINFAGLGGMPDAAAIADQAVRRGLHVEVNRPPFASWTPPSPLLRIRSWK